MVLPVIFLTASANGEVSENFITLYAQARNRLELGAGEIEEIEKMSDAENLEAVLHERVDRLQSSEGRSQLLNIGITAAAASRLEFNANQHACLVRLSDTLGLQYSRQQLEQKIDWLQK